LPGTPDRQLQKLIAFPVSRGHSVSTDREVVAHGVAFSTVDLVASMP